MGCCVDVSSHPSILVDSHQLPSISIRDNTSSSPNPRSCPHRVSNTSKSIPSSRPPPASRRNGGAQDIPMSLLSPAGVFHLRTPTNARLFLHPNPRRAQTTGNNDAIQIPQHQRPRHGSGRVQVLRGLRPRRASSPVHGAGEEDVGDEIHARADEGH